MIQTHLQADPSEDKANSLRLAIQITQAALTSWSKRSPPRARQRQHPLPASTHQAVTHGKSHSLLSSTHIRMTSYFNMSLSQQHFTSGGQYLCLAYSYTLLTRDRTLAGIAALAFTHYRLCRGFWGTEGSCSSQTYYFLFAVECSVVAVMGYTYYLKLKLIEEQNSSRSRRK